MITVVLGCHNRHTWSYDNGDELDNEIIKDIITLTDHSYISGITFTGGDPLSEKNRSSTISLLNILKKRFPEKTFWCWTGHIFEEIYMIPGIDGFDVIIDGKFELDKRTLTLPWRGSSNQRVIDVKKSILSKNIVKYME